MVNEKTRNEAIRQVAAMLKEREKQETIETIARRIGVSRVTLYRLAWAYNEKGGSADNTNLPEQPNDNQAARNPEFTTARQKTGTTNETND